jgi:hypothetical protein
MTPDTFDDQLAQFCARYYLEPAVLRALILGDDRFAERAYLSNRGVAVDPPRPAQSAPPPAPAPEPRRTYGTGSQAPAPAADEGDEPPPKDLSDYLWRTTIERKPARRGPPPRRPKRAEADAPQTEALVAMRPDQAAHPASSPAADARALWDRVIARMAPRGA